MTTRTPRTGKPMGWAARIEARTPEHRDRSVDGLRAIAIAGVVLGHWSVSAVVSDPYQPTALHGESPLSYTPGLAPATWFLQTLGPFFFAAGYAVTHLAIHRKPSLWSASRLSRPVKPVLALAAVWLPAIALLTAIDAPSSTRQLVWALVSQPLWFLFVYLVLTAPAPMLRAATVRCGPWAVLPAVVLIALIDMVRPHGLPLWLQLPAVLVGWAVPYLLGIALAEGRLPRKAGAMLLPLGLVSGTATAPS